jgi:hypothetical protein
MFVLFSFFSFALLFFFLFVCVIDFACFLFFFGNSYDLGIILTCNNIKLMHVCNLVYIVKISFYDASHLVQ